MNYKDTDKPINFVIFGATGDLAKNKILPALFDLHNKNILGNKYRIIGYSRKDLSDQNYREFISAILIEQKKVNETQIEDFLKKVFYLRGDLENGDDYKNLAEYLKGIDSEIGVCSNKIYYLAVPPIMYQKVFEGIDKAKLVINCKQNVDNWTRVLVEKPFGNDLNHAKFLDKKLGSLFNEDQIFRIDHYLAKEATQNIISFRFANAIFEPIWNNQFIDQIQIKLYEKQTAENRINFYDKVGALRDVGQNHLLQMMALIAMEDPGSLLPEKIRQSRETLLGQILPYSKIAEKYAYRAQYQNYKNIVENSKTNTETYFKIKLNVKNKRWDRVPFILESGKGLSENKVEINIIFRDKQSSVCQIDQICHYHNQIKINIQPKEQISICFWNKKPGLNFELEEKNLSFNFSDDNLPLNNAYEKVLFDCLHGDTTLFTSTEEVLREWGIIEKVCSDWQKIPLNFYEVGWNPEGSDILKDKI